MNFEEFFTAIAEIAWVLLCIFAMVWFSKGILGTIPIWYSCNNANWQQDQDRATAQSLCKGQIKTFGYDKHGNLSVVCKN